VAKYKKKRARQLQHDRFRDTTMNLLDRAGDALEGKGRTILYGLGGALLAVILVVVFIKWNARKSDEARQALGRAIDISTASLATSTNPNPLTLARASSLKVTAIGGGEGFGPTTGIEDDMQRVARREDS